MADKEIAIKVNGIGKTFQPQSSSKTIKEGFINLGRKISGKSELKHHKGEYTALKDVSFEVKKGEFFGIVGRNGCGKSTLLKILAGVYTPTKGSVQVNGKLTPFIELGVGFNPELSGRDNVFLNGALLGFTRQQMEAMYDDIVKFAELEDFMDMKLKNYSSGMQVRLAFSVAIRADSDILLIDEVLAVGDESFQRKCYDYFLTLKKNKKTVILVTHDMGAVNKYCTKGILIEKGLIEKSSKAEAVSNAYQRLFDSTIPEYGTKEYVDAKKEENYKYETTIKKIGSKEIYFNEIKLSKKKYDTDEDIKLQANIQIGKKVKQPVIFAYAVKSQDGQVLFGNKYKLSKLLTLSPGQSNKIEVNFPNILYEGIYSIDVSLYMVTDNNYAEIWYDCESFESKIKGNQGFNVITSSSFEEL